MRLDLVELHHIRMRLRAPFESSFGTTLDREAILVRVAGEGLEGWGECVAGSRPDYSYETTATAWHMLTDFLVPAVLSQDLDSVDPYEKAVRTLRGHPMAKAGLEIALWDLLARRAEVPLAEYLGGRLGTVRVGVSVGIQPNERQLVETVGRFVQRGYARVRLKIRPGRDLADVRAVRRSFPTLMLQVDANSAYRLEDLSVFKALDELDLQMIEQPLVEADLLDHSRLQSQLRTPICLDESIRDLDHARWALELGSCRVINIRPGRVGGLSEARRIHDLCKARQIPVWCGGMLETGVGRAANLALATLPNFKLPGDISVSRGYYAEDLVEEPFVLSADGTLPVPAGKGIGVTVRKDLLQRVTLRKARFTPEMGGIHSSLT